MKKVIYLLTVLLLISSVFSVAVANGNITLSDMENLGVYTSFKDTRMESIIVSEVESDATGCTIIYDDNEWDEAWWMNPDIGLAVHFTNGCPSSMTRLKTARFYIASDLATFKWKVLTWTGTKPGSVIASGTTTPTKTGWHDVDVSGFGITVPHDEDFVIAIYWIESEPGPYLGADLSAPINVRSLLYAPDENKWYGPFIDVDWMIRAVMDGDQLAVDISANPSSIPADGVSTSTITATVTSDGSPVSGKEVTFATTLGTIEPETNTTNGEGIATSTLTSIASTTTVTATVTATADGASDSTTVEFRVPGGGSANATRDIEDQMLKPGDSTDITVTITNNVTQSLSLDEDLPAGWTLTRVSDDADSYKPSTNEWVWFSVNAGETKTVVYNLKVPSDEEEDDYTLSGTISNASGVIDTVKGEDTITVGDILDYYRSLGQDPDKVETTDLLKAADDWRDDVIPPGFTEPITTRQLLELADIWRNTE